MSGPHNTSPLYLRQIAEDLRSEGWYTIAGTIAQAADEITEMKLEITELRGYLRKRQEPS